MSAARVGRAAVVLSSAFCNVRVESMFACKVMITIMDASCREAPTIRDLWFRPGAAELIGSVAGPITAEGSSLT